MEKAKFEDRQKRTASDNMNKLKLLEKKIGQNSNYVMSFYFQSGRNFPSFL